MSTPDFELDRQLQALFGGFDTGADFDARLLARLRAESHTDSTKRAVRARQQELTRHRQAVLQLQSWHRSMLRLLAFDTLGVALLCAVVVVMGRAHLSRDVMDISRQYGPYIGMLLAMLVAAVPLLGIRAEQTRPHVV